jgi:hypothetical protein
MLLTKLSFILIKLQLYRNHSGENLEGKPLRHKSGWLKA